MIVPELSGASVRCPVSTPSTLEKKGDGGVNPFEPSAGAEFCGIVSALSDSRSPPAAADTSCSLATDATSADVNAEYGGPRLWTLWPARISSHFPFWQACAPFALTKRFPVPPILTCPKRPVRAGAPVTVTFVPTPYSAPSTP